MTSLQEVQLPPEIKFVTVVHETSDKLNTF